jgi:hypothetical protein
MVSFVTWLTTAGEKADYRVGSALCLLQVPTDVLPALPDIPLPAIHANYRPLPSLELIPSFQPKRKGNFGHLFIDF